MRVEERNETDDDEIAIEQGKSCVATYADKPAEDIDSLWFLLVFPDCFSPFQMAKDFLSKKCRLISDGFLI